MLRLSLRCRLRRQLRSRLRKKFLNIFAVLVPVSYKSVSYKRKRVPQNTKKAQTLHYKCKAFHILPASYIHQVFSDKNNMT